MNTPIPEMTSRRAQTLTVLAFLLAQGIMHAQAVAPAEVPPAAEEKEKKTVPAPKKEEMVVTSGTGTDDDPVMLSPFEVVADDKGYMASKSASGTRLASSMEDIASPVSVVTKQQLLDMAMVDVNDIFRTEGNVEGLYQYTEFGYDRGNVVDTASNNPEAANRIRGLGAANMSVGGMSMSGAIPIDSYNIDSVEISRGANANIFGIGSTSGTVNINVATGNLSRDINKFSFRTDSYGGLRETLDLNRVLIKNKLAFRVTAAYDDVGYVRQPSYDLSRRFMAAVRAQPFKNTSLKLSYETYRNRASRPNMMTPRENITRWQNAGAYTWNPSNYSVYDKTGKIVGTYLGTANGTANNGSNQLFSTYNFAGGIYASSQVRPTVGFIDGNVAYFTGSQNWPYNRTVRNSNGTYTVQYNNGNNRLVWFENPTIYTNVTQVNPATGQPFGLIRTSLDQMIGMHTEEDRALYDWTEYNINAANFKETSSNNIKWEAEQFFIRTPKHQLAMQLGGFIEDIENNSWNFVGNGGDGVQSIVNVDINQTLPDGSPNPGYMRPYLSGFQPQMYRRPEANYTNKAQLAYLVDMTANKGWTKWFGRHNFLAYGEERVKRNAPNALRYKTQLPNADDLIRSNDSWSALNTRYYLGDASGFNFDSPTTTPPATGTFPFTYWSTDYGSQSGVATQPPKIADAQWRTTNAKLEQVYFSQGTLRTEIETKGAMWQGFLLKGRIVPTLGYREDKIRFKSNLPYGTYTIGSVAYQNPDQGLWNFSENYNSTGIEDGKLTYQNRGKTKQYGVVVKPFEWLHLTYNESSSFDPVGLAVDNYGDVLPNPTGKSRDYGVRFNLLDDRLWISINRYKAEQKDNRYGTAQVLASRMIPYDFDLGQDPDDISGVGSGTQRDLFDWYTFRIWGDTSLDTPTGDLNYMAANGLTTKGQVANHVYNLMGFSREYILKMNGLPSGTVLTATADTESKGTEIEVNYRTQNLNVKLTGSETEAMDVKLAPAIKSWLEERLPVWQSAKWTNSTTGITENFWTTTFSGSGTTTREMAFDRDVLSQYLIASANLGKSRPQIRRYKAALTASYRLAGLSDNSIIRNLRTGGYVSWVDKALIGYGYATPVLYTIENQYYIRTYDPTKRYYDKARYTADWWIAYDFKLWGGKIKSSVQLNVQNFLEDGRLQPVAVNSDGTPHAYRIVDPRKFLLTLNVEL